MRHGASICTVVLATALMAGPSPAQVVDFAKYPAFVGQWARTGPPNNWRQLAGPPPLTPEYQKVFAASQAEVQTGRPGNWPSTFCIPEGMPAMMNLYNPMEIVITPETTYILMSHNNDVYRRIYTDGRDWPAEAERTLVGYSIGRWIEAGDGKYGALEVETRYLRGPRAYDATGMPFHADNETVINERIYLDKADKNTLYDEITTIDHALTRPWTITKKYVRETKPNILWYFNDCAENNRHVFIGDDSYFVSEDGFLMPVKKGQKPPDLRYFKSSGK
jgi:hypothetical protein